MINFKQVLGTAAIATTVFFTVDSHQAKGIELDFNSLPSAQGWTYVSNNSILSETDAFSVDGNMLTMDTIGNGFSGQGTNRYTLNGVVDPAKSFVLTMTARLRQEEISVNPNVFGFFSQISINNSTLGFGLGLEGAAGNAIHSLDGNGTVLATNIDVTQFHTYRIEGQFGVGAQFFVDGIFISNISENNQLVNNGLEFGDPTGSANGLAEITSYSFKQDVPEPLTILGTSTALGFGALFKRKTAKKDK